MLYMVIRDVTRNHPFVYVTASYSATPPPPFSVVFSLLPLIAITNPRPTDASRFAVSLRPHAEAPPKKTK